MVEFMRKKITNLRVENPKIQKFLYINLATKEPQIKQLI